MGRFESESRWYCGSDGRDFSFEKEDIFQQTWKGVVSLTSIAWYFGREAISSVSAFGAGIKISTSNYLGNKFKFRG